MAGAGGVLVRLTPSAEGEPEASAGMPLATVIACIKRTAASLFCPPAEPPLCRQLWWGREGGQSLPPLCNRPRLHPRRSGGGSGLKNMYSYIHIHKQCAYTY